MPPSKVTGRTGVSCDFVSWGVAVQTAFSVQLEVPLMQLQRVDTVSKQWLTDEVISSTA